MRAGKKMQAVSISTKVLEFASQSRLLVATGNATLSNAKTNQKSNSQAAIRNTQIIIHGQHADSTFANARDSPKTTKQKKVITSSITRMQPTQHQQSQLLQYPATGTPSATPLELVKGIAKFARTSRGNVAHIRAEKIKSEADFRDANELKREERHKSERRLSQQEKQTTHQMSSTLLAGERPYVSQVATGAFSQTQQDNQQFYGLKNISYQNYKYSRPVRGIAMSSENVSFHKSLMQSQQPSQHQHKHNASLFSSGEVSQSLGNNVLLSSQQNTTILDKLEITMNNVKEQNQRNLAAEDDRQQLDLPMIMQWRSKIMANTLQVQEQRSRNPFSQRDRVQKNLRSLDAQVQRLAVDDLRKSQSKANNLKWLPPLAKYRHDELFVGSNNPVAATTGEAQQVRSPPEDGEIYVNVLHYNQAFHGKGARLRCHFENYVRQNAHGPKKRAEVQRALHKKYHANLIVEEFNRLLKIDQILRSGSDKVRKAIAENQALSANNSPNLAHYQKWRSQIPSNYSSEFISPLTFADNNPVFSRQIRTDHGIAERVLYALKTSENLFDMESLNTFYRVLIFRTASFEEKSLFLSKFMRFQSSLFTYRDFLDVLAQLTQQIDEQHLQQLKTQRMSFMQLRKKVDEYEQRMRQAGLLPDTPDNEEKSLRLRDIEFLFQKEILDLEEVLNYIFN